MDQIVIGFSKPKKWKPFAWLIMAGFNIPFDHVYVMYKSQMFDKNIVFQASHLLVNFMTEDTLKKDNEVVAEFTLPISTGNKQKMVAKAMDLAGTPYGILATFGVALVRLCQLLGITIKNPFADGGSSYFCSELAGVLLEEFENIHFNEDEDDITPPDVYNALKNLKLS